MPITGTRGSSAAGIKALCESLGLHLCDSCSKNNEEKLKTLAAKFENFAKANEQIEEIIEIKKILEKQISRNNDFEEFNTNMTKEIKEIRAMFEKSVENEKSTFDKGNKMDQLTQKIDEIVEENSPRKWSDLFGRKVDLLKNEVETLVSVQKKVTHANDSMSRKNNIVIYNIAESESNPRTKDKESVMSLIKEITGLKITEEDMDENISEMFRLGKRLDGAMNPRPILIKFNSVKDKNLIMESCPNLKKHEKFKNIMINHDLSKEDREEIKRLITEKKKEISQKDDVNKWGLKVRGQPGKFFVTVYKRQHI